MRIAVVFILFCCITRSISRPTTAEENEAEEEYESNNEGANSEITREDDESVAEIEEPELGNNQGLQDEKRSVDVRSEDGSPQAVEEDGGEDAEETQEENDDEQPMRPKYNLPTLNKDDRQYKTTGVESNDDIVSLNTPRGKQHQTNKYIETNDQLEMDLQPAKQRETKSTNRKDGRDVGKKKNKISETKSSSLEVGDLLFGNNDNNVEPRQKDNNGYNSEPLESNEQERYYKHYYNTMQAEHRPNMPEKSFENQASYNRERREIDNNPKDDTGAVDDNEANENGANAMNAGNENEQLSNPSTENEEAAIKRHVKKLSSKELEELLASLSEEKKELLKKIMANDSEFNSDNINKREITKKAGASASDDNNLIEGAQSDVSKLREGSSPGENIDDSQPSSGATPNSKQTETTEITELAASKSTEPSSTCSTPINKANLKENIDDLKQDKSKTDASLIENNKDNNDVPTIKTDTKREVKISDNTSPVDEAKYLENKLNSKESLNDESYMCPQDDEFSEIIEEDSQSHNGNGNSLKREAADISESLKSLEESFPNSNAYDDNYPYANSMLAPLVRVKRRNIDSSMKKRAAALSPDANVAYVPYRAENDDEDNDEGNEFDDDGFFDRTSNLAKSNLKANKRQEELSDNDTPDLLKPNSKYRKLNNPSKNSQIENMESDTMSLGSDTDGVISGVEGVDDNLMYNSASRNKRTEEDSKTEEEVEETESKIDRYVRSTPVFDDEAQTPSENFISVANYQENDAFGPLPRNYEGELARYKRIRRVKQPTNLEVETSDT